MAETSKKGLEVDNGSDKLLKLTDRLEIGGVMKIMRDLAIAKRQLPQKRGNGHSPTVTAQACRIGHLY